MPFVPAIALLAVGILAVVLVRHIHKRQRLYRDLARQRQALLPGNLPEIWTATDPKDLQPVFARERILTVADFLAPESLEALRSECLANREHVERSYLPGHKKGGTLSYEAIHHRAPTCLAFYHSPTLHRWLSDVVGETLVPTADHDQSSCSILVYDQGGDHINWHYDHNFYRGRHFTVLLSLVNRSAAGGISAGRLMQRKKNGDEPAWACEENTLVIFEGARVLHRASPIADGDLRVMLSMTLCTNPRINPVMELVRRAKDTAYYGPRALID